MTQGSPEPAPESTDPMVKNSVFSNIEPRITLILGKFGSTPESDIIDNLATEIDEHDLDICRQMLFEESKSVISKTLKGQTIPDFTMKRRINPGKNVSYAKDVVALGLYLCELKSEYPHELLSKPGTYVALRNRSKSTNDISIKNCIDSKSNGGPSVSDECKNDDKCDECVVRKVKIDSLNDLCISYKKDIDTLKNDVAVINDLCSMYKKELDTFKSEYVNANVEFVGRLCQMEKKMGIQNQQNPNRQHPNQQGGSHGQTSQPPPSNNESTVEGATSTAVNQSLDTSVRLVMPATLTDTQLRNLDPSELIARADQMGQVIDQESSSSSDSDNSVASSVSNNVGSSSEDDTDDEVFITHADVGTSPKAVRMNEGRPYRGKKNADQKSSAASKDPVKPALRKPSQGPTPRKRTKSTSSQNKFSGAGNKPKSKYIFEGKQQPTEVKSRSNTLYLQNIAKQDCSPKELADNIKEYASKKGYLIKYARIFQNNSRNVVSCKIVVPESQSEELIGESSRAWPQGVTCRRWRESGPPSADNPEPNYKKTNMNRPDQNRRQTYKPQSRNNKDWTGRTLNKGKFSGPNESSSSDWESDEERLSYKSWYKNFMRKAYENEMKHKKY